MAPSRIPKPDTSSNLGNAILAAKVRKEKAAAKTTLKSRLLQRRQGITTNDAPDSSFWDIEATDNSVSMNQQQASEAKFHNNNNVEASVWDLIAQEEVAHGKKKSSSKIPIKKNSPRPKYKSTIKATSKPSKSGPDDDYIPDESSQVIPKTKKAGQRKLPVRKTKKAMATPSSPVLVATPSPLSQPVVEAQDKTLVEAGTQEPETIVKKPRPTYFTTAEAITLGIGAPLELRMSQSIAIKAVAVPTEDPVRHYSPPQSPVDTSMGVLEDTTLVPGGLEAEPTV
ncbi:hypothetical protein TWF970_000179 [Orbilia oligospora]|uniref:Uncharacterized protein n=1 Tax=Orbilia oligospora TaxID=2813651 RepID=A0A7C8RJV3_ORBOL|nr:hypothetical protein TWF970_000179 [Orbilia oligospora]